MSFITSPKPSSGTSNWRLGLFLCPTQFPVMPLLLPHSSCYSHPGFSTSLLFSAYPSLFFLSLPLFSPVSVPHLLSFLPFLPRLGLAEQAWQADSFGFRRIKATFLLWQPALSCHLIALASHFSGQPLPLDRPLSLPIMLSADRTSLLRRSDTPHTHPTPPRRARTSPLPYQCNYFFDKPSISLNFKSTLHWYPLLSPPLQLLASPSK